MEIWKWFAVGAAILALALAAIVMLPWGSQPTTADGRLLDRGTFVVVQEGWAVVEESFQWSEGPEQQMLHSVCTIEGAQFKQLTAELTMDKQGAPTQYSVTTGQEQIISHITISVEEGWVEFTFQVDGAEYSERLPTEGPVAVIDNNIMSHWLVLYSRVGRTDSAWQGTAVIPQSLATLPLIVQAGQTGELVSGTSSIPVNRLSVLLGDTEVALYGQGGHLLAVSYPGMGALAWRWEVFPNGIEVRQQAAPN